MPFFEGSRGQIHHDSWQPEGEIRGAVLLLHGYGEHLGLYDALARRLTRDGHVVHALDEVGHGRSDGERAVIESWDVLVEDARRLAVRIADEHPGVPLTVIGHSGGALAAYLLACRYPGIASRLVLSGAPLQPLEWVAAELDGGADEPGELDPTGMLSTHPDYVHALLHDPLTYRGGFPQETLRAITQAWPAVDRALAEGQPDLPVLMVHGELDPVVPVEVARAVAARLPRAELRTFVGDLHDVLNEHNRDEVHDVVAAWLPQVVAVPATSGGRTPRG
jgi:alpha-beta hydrolase superfamily lysophospholipase